MNKKQSFFVVCLLLFLAGVTRAWAQSSHANISSTTTPITVQKQVTTGAPVYFRIAQSGLDLDFKQNNYNLDALLRSINTIVCDPNYVVKDFTVTGTASPDGSFARNIELAGQRAQVLADWLAANVASARGKINVVNGGENWTALRSMVAASQMPYRNEILIVMDAYPNDRERLKYLLQTYADGVPWRWISENIFPELRMGAGLSQTSEVLSATSLENWRVLRSLVAFDTKVLSAQQRGDVLYIMDNMTDAAVAEQQLKNLDFGSPYISLCKGMFPAMLNAPDAQAISNWSFIRDRVAASDMKERVAVLDIIDNVPIYQGREKRLRELSAGVPYKYIRDNIFPQLLCVSSSLADRNWALLGLLSEVSEAPNKGQIVDLCNSHYSSTEKESRLRAMYSGRDYTYVYNVLVPELLSLLTPTAADNWRQFREFVAKSSFLNKDQILDIIDNTSVADGRLGAIGALDRGATLGVIQARVFPLLLTGTQSRQTPISGSGISLTYELSAAARARQAAMNTQNEEVGQAAQNNGQHNQYKILTKRPKTQKALLNIKTDLVQWAGVTSDFDGLHAVTPNLSLEFMFARRWSVEVGGSYSNWDAFSGSKGLWAVSQAWVEPRVYFGKADGFRGVYAGVYGLFGSYDIQSGEIGHTGTHVNLGLSLGYVQTLSRSWFLEFGVRGGYRMGKGALYDIQDGHHYYNCDKEKGQFSGQVRLNLTCRIFRNSR